MWDKYKFRCSQLGKLMTNPQRKKDTLSQTTIAYLYQLYDEATYGIKEIIDSKEIRKGIQCEGESISLLNAVHDTFFTKNEEHFTNDFITGTPDIVFKPVIVDIKTSWSFDTFRKAELTKDYFWQVMGYMWLTGIKKGYIAYCLVDTPEEFIEDAIRRLAWQMNMIDTENPEFVKQAERVRENMTFSRIDPEKRVKCFQVDFDQEYIEALKTRIKECRDFLSKIHLEKYGRITFNNVPSKEKTNSTPSFEEKMTCLNKSITEAFEITQEDMDSTKRLRPIIYAKHCLRAMSYALFPNVEKASEYLKVHHTTYLHSIKQHQNLMKYDKKYRENAEKAEDGYRRTTCV